MMLDEIRAMVNPSCVSRIVRDVDVFDRYEEVDTIDLGMGRPGTTVRTVRNRVTGRCSAMKTIEIMNSGNVITEAVMNLRLDHPLVCPLQEVYEDDNAIHLVLELCSGGDLYNRMQEKKVFSEDYARETVRQMMRTVAYLHLNNVCHRDLKLENWVYADDSDDAPLKLIDFGLSTVFSSKGNTSRNPAMTKGVGTAYYMAPEVRCGRYDERCDVWSLGVITFMLLSGRPPFPGADAESIMRRVTRARGPRFKGKTWEHISPDARSFIDACLSEERLRPSAAQALELPWLSSTTAENSLVHS